MHSHQRTTSHHSTDAVWTMGEIFQRKMCLQTTFWVQVIYWASVWSGDSYCKCCFCAWCKFFVASSSLELCATFPTTGKSIALNVCKMHALSCMGKAALIAEDSICTWPDRDTTNCISCHMWEDCDGKDIRGSKVSAITQRFCDTNSPSHHYYYLAQTNQCRCKESADCLNAGFNVCVHVGEDATAENQTMSECEAGLRRCKGETVSLVSILPCPWECRRKIWPNGSRSHTLILCNTVQL